MRLFNENTKEKSARYFEQHPYVRLLVGVILFPLLIILLLLQYSINVVPDVWYVLKSEARYQFKVFVETIITLFYPPWKPNQDRYIAISKIRNKFKPR